MTKLNKCVRRETDAVFRTRAIIIQLEPPSIIRLKEKGRRRWYETTVERVFAIAAKQYAEKVAKERAQARKMRRLERAEGGRG